LKTGTKTQDLSAYLSEPPSFQAVKITEISLHPELPIQVKTILNSQTFQALAPKIFSDFSARFLIRQHPIVVTKTDDKKWACFAGFRSLQIAQTCLPENETIWAMAISEITKNEIIEMSKYDLYLTHLGFSLDDRLWDIELVKLWELTSIQSRKELTPGLTTKKKLANLLDVSAQRLSTPGKTKDRSKQKKFLGQPVLYPSSEKKFPQDQLGELNKIRKRARAENNLADLLYVENEIRNYKKRLPGNR